MSDMKSRRDEINKDMRRVASIIKRMETLDDKIEKLAKEMRGLKHERDTIEAKYATEEQG